MIKCKECGKELSNKAKTCPNCGIELNKKKNTIKFCIIVLSAIIATLVIVKVFLINGGIRATIIQYEAKQEYKNEVKKNKEKLQPYINSTWKLVEKDIKICYTKSIYEKSDHSEIEWIKENENKYCYYNSKFDDSFPLFEDEIKMTENDLIVDGTDGCDYKSYIVVYDNGNISYFGYKFALNNNKLVLNGEYLGLTVNVVYEKVN